MQHDQDKAEGSGKTRWHRRLGKLSGVLIVVAAALGVGLLAWVPKPGGPDTPPQVLPVNVEVEVLRSVPQLAETMLLPGVVEPNRVVKVPSEVSGRIERIACQKGRPCQAGEPLIYLNTDLLKAEHDRAKAAAAFDLREHERILNLSQRGVATTTELDLARMKKDTSQAELDAAAARLERAVIRAPSGGILDDVPVEAGEYVSPGDVAARIVEIDPAKVVVDVPERDVPFLTVGASQEVLAELRGQERPLTGQIRYISELSDPQTRTSRAEITVDNRQRLLRAGQIVRVRLTRRMLKDVVLVPLEAVIPLEDGKAAYVDEGGLARLRRVELGFIRGKSVQVVSGLKDGDRLIVSGHRFVSPGQPVAVTSEKGQPPP